MTPLTLLDLFSGIGGFSLGLQRTGGFRTIAFCECEPYPRAVLAKHWPEVPCYDDVRTLTAARMAADGLVRPDAICGGFPCQDISAAGKGAGLEGERSGLWREMRRLVSECGPRWVVAENVPALRTRGADRVLGDLEALGYACWPLVVGAAHAGAPHRRGRVWILAHSDGGRRQGREGVCRRQSFPLYGSPVPADANGDDGGSWRQGRPDPGSSGQLVAERAFPRLSADVHHRGGRIEQHQSGRDGAWTRHESAGRGADVADADLAGLEIALDGQTGQRAPVVRARQWAVEPPVGRMAYGIPARVDRIAALGNAVVPQVVEAIGRAILAVERGAP